MGRFQNSRSIPKISEDFQKVLRFPFNTLRRFFEDFLKCFEKYSEEFDYLTLFRLGRGGGGGLDATRDLNLLLLTHDCVYSVLTS